MNTPALNLRSTEFAPSSRPHTPSTAIIHYTAEFSIEAAGAENAAAFEVPTAILREWCLRKDRSATVWLNSSSFQAGGLYLSDLIPGGIFRTERKGILGTPPEAWAFYYQHRDNETFARFWHVDVALRRASSSKYLVRITTAYSLDSAFLGWEPITPEPAAPAFVSSWLMDERIKLRAGSMRLAIAAPASDNQSRPQDRLRALRITAGDADKLRQFIFGADRTLPAILVNGEINPVTFPINPDVMQRRVLGTAYVLWAPPSAGWRDAWNRYFPRGYSCPINSVRVYQPFASADRQGDCERHRFFGEDEIRKNGGAEAFVTMLQRALIRRLMAPYSRRIATCDDVVALRRDADFAAQKSQINSKEEELTLYEDEHKRLTESVQTSNALLQELETERDQANTDLAALRPLVATLQDQLDRTKAAAAAKGVSVEQQRALENFLASKARPLDILRLLNAAFPGELVLLPSAIKSAEEAKAFEHNDELRDLLVRLVTRYRSALMSDGDHVAKNVFGRNEYSANESSLSVEGQRARRFRHGAREIEMHQHLKIGVKDSVAHCIRVHFYWDSASQKIIIGHCGEHLPL